MSTPNALKFEANPIKLFRLFDSFGFSGPCLRDGNASAFRFVCKPVPTFIVFDVGHHFTFCGRMVVSAGESIFSGGILVNTVL